ncbi:MAG: DMT family transporter [Thermoplasmata archaeon]|jgi:drug/metabolite transporter (DMT)-like permease|nr:DMT family transporter [Thermoplasmatales archaeon]PMP75294.1 MAG: hypothetical protein C0180_01710 [Aciduliprofundum sp.]
MKKTYQGYIYMTLVSLIWGIGYTAVKILLQVMDPFTLGAARFIFSLIFFVPIVIILREKIYRRDLPLLFLMGLTGVALYQIFYNSGAQGVSAGLGSILISTEPIFIYLISVSLRDEKFNVFKMFGIIISFFGIFLIFVDDIRTISGFISMILILLASLSWSLYTIISKNLLQRYSVLFVTSISTVLGTLIILPFFLNFPSEFSRFNNLDLFSLVFLVLFTTIIAFYLNFKGIQILSPPNASVFYYLAPVFTIASAYLLLHEIINAVTIIGGSLVIAGVALVNKF